MFRKNPCLTCGACCAHFRVSFYWGESDSETGGTVPIELTEDISPYFRAMKGTNQKHPRCIALEGNIGGHVGCSIYAVRSNTCADFGIHWQAGIVQITREDLISCNKARKHHGLREIAWQPMRFEINRPVMKHAHHLLRCIHPIRKPHKSQTRTGSSSVVM